MGEDNKTTVENKKINPFTVVTPLSKILALIIFVALPFIGYFLGWSLKNNITSIYSKCINNSDLIKPKQVANVPSNTQTPSYPIPVQTYSNEDAIKMLETLKNSISPYIHIDYDTLRWPPNEIYSSQKNIDAFIIAADNLTSDEQQKIDDFFSSRGFKIVDKPVGSEGQSSWGIQKDNIYCLMNSSNLKNLKQSRGVTCAIIK